MDKREGMAVKLARIVVDEYLTEPLPTDRLTMILHMACGFNQTLKTVEDLITLQACTCMMGEAVEYRGGELV
jgi:hypothetical protein